MRSMRVTWMVLLAAPWLPAMSPAFPLEDHKQITLESLDAIVRPSPAGSPPGIEGVYRFTPASAEQVAKAAAAGDAVAGRVWDETVALLGQAITDLVNILEPDVVVLGGGVTRSGAQLLDPVRAIVADTAIDT